MEMSYGAKLFSFAFKYHGNNKKFPIQKSQAQITTAKLVLSHNSHH